MTYLEKRFVPNDSQEIRYDDVNIVVYVSKDLNGNSVAIAYSGRKSKSDFYNRFKDVSQMENKIEGYVKRAREVVQEKEDWKAEKKKRGQEFKATVKVGSFLRTSFSYNMTFNDFFEVLEIKGNKVTLAEVASKWVSGDAGWTGQVACTTERTGKKLEARFSVNGLKINDRFASICTLNDDFYENHLD